MIDAAKAGDVDAFARVYGRYRSALYAVCLRRLRNPTLAEDVVQDVFIRAWTNLHCFDSTRRLWPWLVTIAQRRCIDLSRRQSRTSLVDDMTESEESTAEFRQRSSDSTLDAVLNSEVRADLERALAGLPPRQRRALLLHVLEGWNYSDIASAESASVSSVKSLIFRARAQLRRVCEAGAMGAFVFPLRRFRRRAQGAGYRMAGQVEIASGGLGSSFGAFASGAIALSVIFGSVNVIPAIAGQAGVASRHVQAIRAPSSRHLAPKAISTEGSGGNSGSRIPRVGDIGDQAIDPGKDATPDNTTFDSIVPSPNYRSDRTVFAAGQYSSPMRGQYPVMFVSHDAGSHWERLIARDLEGTQVILPPAYPLDARIFSMGPTGLQLSEDRGASFQIVNPLTGAVAISPAFNKGDPRILIATAPAVQEYWADKKLMKPAPMTFVAQGESTVAFAPDYQSSQLILLGTRMPSTSGGDLKPAIARCEGAVCGEIDVPGRGIPQFRFSSRYGVNHHAYSFTRDYLLSSNDAGQTFSPLPIPALAKGFIRDVAIGQVRNTDGRVGDAIFGATSRGSLMYRSLDSGRTWDAIQLPVPAFRRGLGRIVVLPDGRLLVAGLLSGLATSPDAGSSWAAAAN